MKRLGVVVLMITMVVLFMVTLPVIVFAEVAEGTVGETSAIVDTDAGTAEADASAAASDITGESIGPVAAETNTDPGTDFEADGGGETAIENGGGSTTTIEEWSTSAGANYANDTGIAEADESVWGVEVTAPDLAPVETLVEADQSEGESLAVVGEAEEYPVYGRGELRLTTTGDEQVEVIETLPPQSYAISRHSIGHTDNANGASGGDHKVSLYDGAIEFDGAGAVAGAAVDASGTPIAYAYAYVNNLRVWDPDSSSYTTAGYTDPLNVDSVTWTEVDINTLLAALNAVLVKINIEITSIVETLEETGTDWAHAHATAIETALYDDDGFNLATVVVCDDDAYVTPTVAEANDYELMFAYYVPEPEELEVPVELTGKLVEAVVETVDEVPEVALQPVVVVETEAALPYTGASFGLLAFLAVGLLSTGVILRRKNL